MAISLNILHDVEQAPDWELALKGIRSGLLALELDIADAYKRRDQERLSQLNPLLAIGMKLADEVESVLELNPVLKTDFIKNYPWEPGDAAYLIYAFDKWKEEMRQLKKTFAANAMHQTYMAKLDLLEKAIDRLRGDLNQ